MLITFPAAERHRLLAGTKLYCLVTLTKAHGCEQLAQCCTGTLYLIPQPCLLWQFDRLIVIKSDALPCHHQSTLRHPYINTVVMVVVTAAAAVAAAVVVVVVVVAVV